MCSRILNMTLRSDNPRRVVGELALGLASSEKAQRNQEPQGLERLLNLARPRGVSLWVTRLSPEAQGLLLLARLGVRGGSHLPCGNNWASGNRCGTPW